MLELRQMSCGYGLVTVVDELDLGVSAGSVTALLGPNGAGKSSTIMAIAGHVAVKSGDVTFEGRDINGLLPAERTKLGIGLVPEGRRVFPDLTIAENLLVGGYTRSSAEADKNETRVLEIFPRLRERYRQRSGTLSGGEQQMLAIARALMATPRLIMIDELSLGLMPAMVDICLNAINELKKDGLGVLLVEQNTERALAVADRVIVLAAGRKVYDGDASGVRDDAGFADRFLGIGSH